MFELFKNMEEIFHLFYDLLSLEEIVALVNKTAKENIMLIAIVHSSASLNDDLRCFRLSYKPHR